MGGANTLCVCFFFQNIQTTIQENVLCQSKCDKNSNYHKLHNPHPHLPSQIDKLDMTLRLLDLQCTICSEARGVHMMLLSLLRNTFRVYSISLKKCYLIMSVQVLTHTLMLSVFLLVGPSIWPDTEGESAFCCPGPCMRLAVLKEPCMVGLRFCPITFVFTLEDFKMKHMEHIFSWEWVCVWEERLCHGAFENLN